MYWGCFGNEWYWFGTRQLFDQLFGAEIGSPVPKPIAIPFASPGVEWKEFKMPVDLSVTQVTDSPPPDVAPCPYCGSGLFCVTYDGQPAAADSFRVSCVNCGACGPRGTLQGVFERWNKRSNDANPT